MYCIYDNDNLSPNGVSISFLIYLLFYCLRKQDLFILLTNMFLLIILQLSWFYIRDFNATLGACVHCGRGNPSSISFDDFWQGNLLSPIMFWQGLINMIDKGLFKSMSSPRVVIKFPIM
jgi:hypothetical protein